jgi:hypothetical protein
VLESGARATLHHPTHDAVGKVGETEQKHLAQHVQPSLWQDARLQEAKTGDHRGEA